MRLLMCWCMWSRTASHIRLMMMRDEVLHTHPHTEFHRTIHTCSDIFQLTRRHFSSWIFFASRLQHLFLYHHHGKRHQQIPQTHHGGRRSWKTAFLSAGMSSFVAPQTCKFIINKCCLVFVVALSLLWIYTYSFFLFGIAHCHFSL